MRTLACTILLCVVLSAGCGGGGGGGDGGGDGTITDVFYVVPGQHGCVQADGWVWEGAVDVGDYTLADEQAIRGFYRFDIDRLPAGVTVNGAQLVMSAVDTFGLPFQNLGFLWLDHVDIGHSLEATDYGLTPVTAAVDHLSENPGTDPFSFDVTVAVQEDARIEHPTCDFRLRFALLTDNDGFADYLRLPRIYSGDDAVRLVVTYIP